MFDEEIRQPECAPAHLMSRQRNWLSAALLAALAFFNAGTVFAQYTISTFATSQPPNYTITAGQADVGNGVAVDPGGGVYFTGTYPAAPPLSGNFNAILENLGGNTPIAVVGINQSNHPSCANGASPMQLQLNPLGGVAVDNGGNIYVAQNGNADVFRVSGGTVTCLSGDEGATGIAADNSGHVYFSLGQQGESGVYEVTLTPTGMPFGPPALVPGTLNSVCTVSGMPHGMQPEGLALDAAAEHLYIADIGCHEIWSVTLASGAVTPVAGTPGVGGFTGDGQLATSAKLDQPYGVAVDSDGNIYIADFGNNRVRKVAGGIINTIAGNGNPAGDSGDCGAATSMEVELNGPRNVALGLGGTIYIGELNDIRELTPGTQVFNPPPGSVLTPTTTFSWCSAGPSPTTQYTLDVSDQTGLIFHGVTSITSLTVSGIPCNGSAISVQFQVNSQTPSNYTYTSCKMLHLNVSPSPLPRQGGTVTITAEVENFTAASETVVLNIYGSIEGCRMTYCVPYFACCPRHLAGYNCYPSDCSTLSNGNVTFSNTLTLDNPYGIQTISQTQSIPAIQPPNIAGVLNLQANVTTTPGGTVLDTATASITQN